MNLFTSYTYSWWQIGIFKVAMLTIGIAFGAYIHEWVLAHIVAIITIAVISSVYISLVSFRQLG